MNGVWVRGLSWYYNPWRGGLNEGPPATSWGNVVKRRLSVSVLAAMLLATVGIAPAAAQSFDGEILVAQPSLDEVCALFEDLDEDLGDLEELEDLFGGMEMLEAFEPEPVDDADYADVADALRAVLDGAEDADSITAMTDGTMLSVTLMPDITQCEGLEDLDIDGGEFTGGTFLIQPTVEEYCGFFEDQFDGLTDDLDDELGDLDEDAMDDDAMDMEQDLEALEGFFPEPVGDDQRGEYEAIGAALVALLDGADEADEATASYDGETLAIALVPGIERCDDVFEDIEDDLDEFEEELEEDLAEDVEDDGEEVEAPTRVDSGTGVSSSGPSPLLLVVLLGLALVTAGGLTARRTTS
jgi:hypothetical protein